MKKNFQNMTKSQLVQMIHHLVLETDQKSENKDHYADLFELSPVPYLILGSYGIIKEVNLAGANLLGKKMSQLVGWPFLHAVQENHFRKFLSHLRKCRLTLDQVTSEIYLKGGGGKGNPRPVQIHSYPYKDRGSSTVFLTTLIDLSQRFQSKGTKFQIIKTEGGEAEVKERRKALLSEVNKTLLVSQVQDVRDRMEKLLKVVTPNFAEWCTLDLLEKNDHFPPLSLSLTHPFVLPLVREIKNSRPSSFESPFDLNRVLRPPRPEFVAEISDAFLSERAASPWHLQALRNLGPKSYLAFPLQGLGKVLGVMTFISLNRHFTPDDFRLAEELCCRVSFAIDNSRLSKEAQEAISIRDQFLSMAAHELKTPLTPLKLRTQLMGRHLEGLHSLGKEDKEKWQKMLSSLNTQISQIQHLVEELVDISRLQSGRFCLEPGEVDLGELIETTVALFSDQIRDRGAPINISMENSVTGYWDSFRLEQVLVNLINNALKYGKGRPINIHGGAGTDAAFFEVEDQGIGIGGGDLKRIFECFEKGGGEEQVEGLGIGLYISKKIIEAHGGAIQVQSRLGRGTKFAVTLPLDSHFGRFPPLKRSCFGG